MYLNNKGLFKSLNETKEAIAAHIQVEPQYLFGSIFMLGMDCSSIPKHLTDNCSVDFLIMDKPNEELGFVVVEFNTEEKLNKRVELSFKSAKLFELKADLKDAYQAYKERKYAATQ